MTELRRLAKSVQLAQRSNRVHEVLYFACRLAVRIAIRLFRQAGSCNPQRVVLVPFPHPGMKVPAFVTGSCRDIETGKVILCVYVPTTPVPTSGYYLLVPEEEVTEPRWTPEETLQAIISGGLTAPPEVRYFANRPTVEAKLAAARNTGERLPNQPADGCSSPP
jgi:uncharacterized membrane protein